VLDDSELARVLNAAKSMGYPFGPFVELLMLTAQPEDEIAGMRWSEIDGQKWTIPGHRSKNGKDHLVHLSAPALAVLAELPRDDQVDLVFTTTGTTPISGFSKAKEKIDRISGVRGWRFHDIRRTVTTGLANLGHSPHVADKILNHRSGAISGVAAVYQKAEFKVERENALTDWGNYILGLRALDRHHVDCNEG